MRFRYLLQFTILVIIVTSCKNNENKLPKNDNEKALFEVKNLIEDGDLVLRLEDDMISFLVAGLSPKDKTYSHCGLAKKEGDEVYIYNILPPGNPNLPEQIGIRKTLIDTFLDPQMMLKFAVYKYAISKPQITEMLSYIETLRSNKVTYDAKFDNKSDTSIYCSELIAKALQNATKNEKKINTTFVENTKILGVKNFFKFMNDSVDLSKYPVYPIDMLYLNDFSTKKFSYQYDTKLRNRANFKK
jgi:hypothetical protein